MRVRLTSRTFSDFGVFESEIPLWNFIQSVTGKVNISTESPACSHNCKLSLFQATSADDFSLQLSPNIKRGMRSQIDSSLFDTPSLVSLRRRNIPLPPTGAIAILRQGQINPLKGAMLRRGDTHVLLATIYGDFPAEPELVFAAKYNSETLFVKSNKSTQGDISILEIVDAGLPDVTQKLTAQIVIHPGETVDLERQTVLFYTLEVVEQLADEVYTIETDKVTIVPDVINYFATK